jgi:hypothetical protein
MTPRLDDEGWPLDGYDEVIAGLAQADTMWTPAELLDEHGFAAVFDLCGWPRDGGMQERPYVFFRLDDVPVIPDPRAIDDLGASVAALARAGQACRGELRSRTQPVGTGGGSRPDRTRLSARRGDPARAGGARTVGAVERRVRALPVDRVPPTAHLVVPPRR